MFREEHVTEDTYLLEPGKLVTVRVIVSDCDLEEQYSDILLPGQQCPEEFVVLAKPRPRPKNRNEMMVVKVRR